MPFGIAYRFPIQVQQLQRLLPISPLFDVAPAGTILFSGLPSTNAFGTLELDDNISFAGIASTSAFGTLAVQELISFSGIASASAFGTLVLNPNIVFVGLANGNAFGTPVLNDNIVFTGLSSTSAFGTASFANAGTLVFNINFIGLAHTNNFGLASFKNAQDTPQNSDIDPAIPYTVLQQLAPEVIRWLRREMEKIKAKDEAIIYVTGNPEGVVTARPGTIALNNLGGAATTVYIKESGLGATGWVAK